MELSDSKGPIPQTRNRPPEIRSATGFHFSSLSRCRLWYCVAEGARGYRFTSCTDRVACRDTNRTSRIRIGKADSPPHEAIKVRRVNMRITERSDGIKPLLVGHDKQYIGPGGRCRSGDCKWFHKVTKLALPYRMARSILASSPQIKTTLHVVNLVAVGLK